MKSEDEPMTVLEGLVGINQILDAETSNAADMPPNALEPFTWQILRLFKDKGELPRDQMQKFLRGTGMSPSEFEKRGWATENNKIYCLSSPSEIAQTWKGKQKAYIRSDYDQAMILIGACMDNSEVNANDTLRNPGFKPHPNLNAVIEWLQRHPTTPEVKLAADIAHQVYIRWAAENERKRQEQLDFFGDLGMD